MIINGRTVYDGVLNIPENTSGSFSIKHRIRPAGTTLRTGNMRTAIYGQKHTNVLFPDATRWHMLKEDEGVWMTDDPIEQRQHDEQLRGMRGHVLVGGLGLGLAVIALAHKRGVKSITVVEKSQDVVNLTWDATVAHVKSIRPTLNLTLIVDDLFTYLRAWKPVLDDPSVVGRPFDHAFYDIWQSDGETTFHQVVIPLRQLSVGKVGRVVCWNEDVMRGQLMMGLTTRLQLMNAPAEHFKALGGISLDDLTKPQGSVYVDWAIPFWSQVREQKLSGALARRAAKTYAKRYGLERA